MHLQGAHAHPLLEAAAGAPQQGAAAGGQFLQAERLTQHVVGTAIEQAHHRLGAGARGEHHHWTVQLGGKAQGTALIQQFGAHQQVGGLVPAELDRLAGRGHRRRQVTVLAQALGQHRAQGGMGIHNQDPLGAGCRCSRRHCGFRTLRSGSVLRGIAKRGLAGSWRWRVLGCGGAVGCHLGAAPGLPQVNGLYQSLRVSADAFATGHWRGAALPIGGLEWAQ